MTVKRKRNTLPPPTPSLSPSSSSIASWSSNIGAYTPRDDSPTRLVHVRKENGKYASVAMPVKMPSSSSPLSFTTLPMSTLMSNLTPASSQENIVDAWRMDVESNKIGSSLVFEADCGSEGSESMAEMDPSGRTKKRFRDSRPNEGIIHERTLQKLFSAQRTASTDVSQLPDDDQMNEEIGSQHTSQYISSSAAPELPRQTSTLDAFLGINRSQSTDHDSNNIHAHDINSGKIKRPPMHRLAPFAAPATHLSSLTPTSNTEASHPTFSFSSSSSLSTSLLPSSSAYSAFQLPPTQPSLPSFFLPTPTQTPPPNHKTLDQYGFASAIAANAAATMAPVDGDSDTGMADVDVDAGFGVALSCSSSMDVEIGNGEMAMG